MITLKEIGNKKRIGEKRINPTNIFKEKVTMILAKLEGFIKIGENKD